MFITDRDLLAYEPNLFRDLAWAAQTLISGQGSVSGVSIEIDSSPTCEERDVRTGHVLMGEGVAHEVIDRVGSTELYISAVRASPDDPILPPMKYTGATVYVSTFLPQIALAHRHVLRLIGIDPDVTTPGGLANNPDESSVMNPRELGRIEALLTLYHIYTAAASSVGAGSLLHARADMYLRRFEREKGRIAAQLDLDGDGISDDIRRPSLATMGRA